MINKDYEIMKEFFYQHKDKFVAYDIDLKNSSMYSDYFTPEPFVEACYIKFVGPHLSFNNPQNNALYYIDSYDSFVFGIYLVNYGDRIEFSDLNRTWECGVEAFEGSELPYVHLDLVKDLVYKHGFCMENTEIHKITTLRTFKNDAINLTKIMLMINYIQAKPPIISYKKPIQEDIRALRNTWLKPNSKLSN